MMRLCRRPEELVPHTLIGIGLTIRCLGKGGWPGPCGKTMTTDEHELSRNRVEAVTMKCRFGKDLWRDVE